jgi:hypothetical protein
MGGLVLNLVLAFFAAAFTIALPVELFTGIPYRDLVSTERAYLTAVPVTAAYWCLFTFVIRIRW